MSTYGTTTPETEAASSTTFGTEVADREDEPGSEVAQQVRDVTAEAKDHAKDVVSTAADEAKSVTSEVKEHARDLLGQTRARVNDELGSQVGRFAGSIDNYATQLQTMAARADDPDDTVPQLVRQASVRMQTMASRMQARGPEMMLEDLKRFARRRPGVFVFGALGAGFVVGRFIRNVDRQAISDAVKGNGNGNGSSGVTPALPYEAGTTSTSATYPATATMSTSTSTSTSTMSSPATPSSGSVVDLTDPLEGQGQSGDV
jgi:hypothetical protein